MAKNLLPSQDEESENWLTTYADVVTLLLSFFILLVSMALYARKDSLKPFAPRFKDSIKKTSSLGIGQKKGGMINKILHPFSTDAEGNFVSTTNSKRVQKQVAYLQMKAQEKITRYSNIGSDAKPTDLDEIKAMLYAITLPKGVEDLVEIKYKDKEILIKLKEKIFFDLGKAYIKPRFRKTLKKICSILRKTSPKSIIVEGHTDSHPIKTSRFPSNWELGGARAAAVIDTCKLSGIPLKFFKAQSYADTVPDEELKKPTRRIVVRVKHG